MPVCVHTLVCEIIHIRYSKMVTFLHEETPAQLLDLGWSSRQVKSRGWRVKVGAGKGVSGLLEMSREEL